MSRINELMMKEESEDLEFKKKWRDEHLKTLSAFANSTGGELILGQDDKRKREIHYTLCEPKMSQKRT